MADQTYLGFFTAAGAGNVQDTDSVATVTSYVHVWPPDTPIEVVMTLAAFNAFQIGCMQLTMYTLTPGKYHAHVINTHYKLTHAASHYTNIHTQM